MSTFSEQNLNLSSRSTSFAPCSKLKCILISAHSPLLALRVSDTYVCFAFIPLELLPLFSFLINSASYFFTIPCPSYQVFSCHWLLSYAMGGASTVLLATSKYAMSVHLRPSSLSSYRTEERENFVY